MRNPKLQSLLPALLCGAALFAFACNRGEETRAGQVSTEASTQVAQAPAPVPPAPAPQINELQNPPQSVTVPPTVPPSPPSDQASLDARERELAAREAELNARERRLQERPAPRSPRPSRPAPPAPVPAPESTEEPDAAPEPAPAEPEPQPEEPMPQPEPQPQMTTMTVPAGTQMDVEFTRTLASNSSSPGDAFRTRVNRDVVEDGVVVIPAGSEIVGEVAEAVPLKKIGGQAKLVLRFTDLVLPSGKTVPIQASFVQEGRNETKRDAATIGGAAAGGAVLGRILNKGGRSKGSILGALIGAAAGAAIAARTPGEEVVFPQGSVVSLSLDRPLDVRVRAGD